MKIKKISITFIVTIILFSANKFSVEAAKTNDLSINQLWAQTFGTSLDDRYDAIDTTSDGGYITSGSTYGNNYDVAGRNHGSVDALVSRYDKKGNLVWSKIMGGTGEDYLEEVKVLKNGNIALAGYTQSSNSGDITALKYGWDSSWLTVLDSDGNRLWTQVNGRGGTYGYASFRGITETQDGNIVCAGYAYGPTAGNIPGTIKGERDTFIAKFNATTGTRMWYTFSGGSLNETFFDVIELENGKLVAVGQSESNDGDFAGKNKGGFDAMVIVYTANGVLESTRTFGGSKNDNYTAVVKTSTGKFITAGNTDSSDGDITSPTFGSTDGLFVTYSSTGDYEWHKIIGGDGKDYLTYMAEGIDGNYSFVGYTNSKKSGNIALASKGGQDGLFGVLSKTDGTLEHIVLYGGAGDDIIYSVEADKAGGYAVVGSSSSATLENVAVTNRGLSDAFVAKFKTNNVPELIVPVFTEITVGQNFDLMTGVSAEDFEDGIITSDVVIDSTFNKNVAGVYPVKYSVEDYEGNVSEGLRVVVVNDGTYKIGTDRILHADDYTIRTGQVVNDLIDVSTRANVEVWDKSTGLIVDEITNLNVNYGTYNPTVGVYPIQFSLKSEPTVTTTINANVVQGNAPTLVVTKYSEIAIGDYFDPMQDATSTDTEDGDLTADIKIMSDIDNNTPGLYEIFYSVTDSDGNITQDKQVVVVKGSDVTIGDKYVIFASDFEIFTGNVTGSDQEIIDKSALSIYSKETNTFVTKAVTINKGTYTNVVGTYVVNISIDEEPAVNIDITISVVAGASPKIVNANFTEISLNAVFNPVDNVELTDDKDSFDYLSNNLQITGNVDTSVAGVYKLSYAVTDSDFNVTTVNRIVVVNDGSIKVGNAYIIQAYDYEIKSRNVVVAKDDINANTQLKVYRKSSGALENNSVVSINYGAYSSQVNVYPIEYKIKADRFATRVINATVTLGAAPVIVADYNIQIAPTSNFVVDDYLQVTDVEDGNLIDSVVMTTFDSSVVGVYPVTYSVTDIDGNTTTFNQIIVVNDGTIKTTADYYVTYHSFTINVEDVIVTDAAIIQESGVRIWDLTTGVELGTDIVEVTKYDYTNIPGVYKIMLSITTDRSLYDFVNGTVIGNTPEPIPNPIPNLPVTGSQDFTTITLTLAFMLILVSKLDKHLKNQVK